MPMPFQQEERYFSPWRKVNPTVNLAQMEAEQVLQENAMGALGSENRQLSKRCATLEFFFATRSLW